MHKFFILAIAATIACVQADSHAEIVELTSEINGDGSYKYDFETSNGITAEESGIGGHHATGSFSYTAPEGEPIKVTYTADENGFQPKGDHIPEIPYQILEALEYIRTHPEYDESAH